MKATEEQKVYMREYTRKNFVKINARKRKYYSEHNTARANRNKARGEYRQRIKEIILTHYGNGGLVCVKCGYNRSTAALTIDHINGGGGKDRRLNKHRIGHPFYLWLRKNNYPEGYQTLCMNCQFIKKKEEAENQWITTKQ